MFGLDTKETLHFLMTVVSLAIAIAAWLRKPGEDAQAGLQAHITGAFTSLSGRTTTVEERLKHMPTSEELADLAGTVKQVDERTKGLNAGLDRQRVQLDRIEQYLLNSKT